MASKNVSVTKFKVDDVHLAIEDIGKLSTEAQKPANLVSKKVAAQLNKAGDVDVTTDKKLAKAVADAKKKFGFVGEYTEEGKGKLAYLKSQADAIKKKANEVSSSGRGAYKEYYENPISYAKATKSSVLSQVRSVAGMRFKIDDLLIGEGARKLLQRAIGEVCGTSNLSPFNEFFKSHKDLLNILDNMNLFSNSDLLSAIGKCERFSDDHVKMVSAKTTEAAEEGNTQAYSDMIAIPGVRGTGDDIIVLTAAAPDTQKTADNLIIIHDASGRPVKQMLMTEIPPESEFSSIEPIDVLDSVIINKTGNKDKVIQAVATRENLTFSPKMLSKASAVVIPPVKGAIKEQLALKGMVDDRLSNPVKEAMKIKISAGLRLRNDDTINTGTIRSIDTSRLSRSARTVSTSPSATKNWNTVGSEVIAPPSTAALDRVDAIIETKLNNVTYVHTEDPIVNVKPKKTFAEQVPWMHLSPEDSLVVKKIKSWKQVIDKRTGEELLIPVY